MPSRYLSLCRTCACTDKPFMVVTLVYIILDGVVSRTGWMGGEGAAGRWEEGDLVPMLAFILELEPLFFQFVHFFVFIVIMQRTTTGAARRIYVGQSVRKRVCIRAEDVIAFGDLVDDHNPIHCDPDAAKAAGFPAPICHGLLAGSFFSGLMATELPGPQTVYLSQNLRFTAPIFVGDEIEVSVTVEQFRQSKGLISMKTCIHKVDPLSDARIMCVDGSAVGMNKTVEFEGESEWTVRT